jgi:hypothetical protein
MHSPKLDRIRAEYARRRRELPPDLYSWGRVATQFLYCQLMRACIGTLVREGLFPLDRKRIADIGCGARQLAARFY